MANSVTQKHVLITASTTSNVIHRRNHTLIDGALKVTHFVVATSNVAHRCNHKPIDGTVCKSDSFCLLTFDLFDRYYQVRVFTVSLYFIQLNYQLGLNCVLLIWLFFFFFFLHLIYLIVFT